MRHVVFKTTKRRLILTLIILGVISLTNTRFKNLIKLINNDKTLSQTEKFTSTISKPDENGIVWKADFESGDLSQWPSRRGEHTSFDSGVCKRPSSGVTEEFAHSGKYSMKMEIDSSFAHPFKRGVRSGCRQFRYPEARTGNTYFYSAWYFLPEHYNVNEWAMLGQFKSKEDENAVSDPVWSYRLENDEGGKMRLALRYKADMEGPSLDLLGKSNNNADYQITFSQKIIEVPVNEWFHVELLFKQSSDFTGQIALWQNGVELFNFKDVKTVYPEHTASWSVTSYGYDIVPNWFTVYIDDAVISSQRVSERIF